MSYVVLKVKERLRTIESQKKKKKLLSVGLSTLHYGVKSKNKIKCKGSNSHYNREKVYGQPVNT